jgi:hypothetical protein
MKRPKHVSVEQQQSHGRRPGKHCPEPQPHPKQSPPLPPSRPPPHVLHPVWVTPSAVGIVGMGFTPSAPAAGNTVEALASSL